MQSQEPRHVTEALLSKSGQIPDASLGGLLLSSESEIEQDEGQRKQERPRQHIHVGDSVYAGVCAVDSECSKTKKHQSKQ
jgi:hypothetical protein